jgi:hypothetical protein
MALLRTTPLDERVTALRQELDALIDERAAAVAADCPGVPLGVIRNILTRRSDGCQCAAYLELKAKDDAERAA